jgi:hypothetical protein
MLYGCSKIDPEWIDLKLIKKKGEYSKISDLKIVKERNKKLTEP